MSTVTNKIGQRISVGDPVVYFRTDWTEERGTFAGLSRYGFSVHIQQDSTVTRVKGPTGKLHAKWSSKPWVRQPGDWCRHKITGHYIPRSEYYKIPWHERYTNWVEDEGVLKSGYEFVEVPYVFVGPMGLDRTFKLEN